jgi:mRNA interferase RelE/StbE
MIRYEQDIQKAVRKGTLPRGVFELFHHAFMAMEMTGDMNLFDVKRLKSSQSRTYYRLRKGKYRAIFFTEGKDYCVITIAKREEVYKQWE